MHTFIDSYSKKYLVLLHQNKEWSNVYLQGLEDHDWEENEKEHQNIVNNNGLKCVEKEFSQIVL